LKTSRNFRLIEGIKVPDIHSSVGYQYHLQVVDEKGDSYRLSIPTIITLMDSGEINLSFPFGDEIIVHFVVKENEFGQRALTVDEDSIEYKNKFSGILSE
jgi:hypothetical protein